MESVQLQVADWPDNVQVTVASYSSTPSLSSQCSMAVLFSQRRSTPTRSGAQGPGGHIQLSFIHDTGRVGYRMFGTESTEPNIFKYRVRITEFTRTGTGIENILL